MNERDYRRNKKMEYALVNAEKATKKCSLSQNK
jgi:hypothetical protein